MSISVKIEPQDRRCRYWAIVVRAGEALPLPSAVDGANDIKGRYLRNGGEELFEGDVLLQGEANHHVKNRGWTYRVSGVRGGEYVSFRNPDASVKAALKARGLRVELLAGSGQVAACVRVAHAMRDGIALSAEVAA